MMMVRLTHEWGSVPAVPKYFDSGLLMEASPEMWMQYNAMIQRLAAYERTGLLPEEIGTVQQAMKPISFKTFREIMKAERDGRCAILSTPMKPLLYSNDEMDTDVYCPGCGESVSGGWPNSDLDCEMKLYQCPYCGQSIDESKSIPRQDELKEDENAVGTE